MAFHRVANTSNARQRNSLELENSWDPTRVDDDLEVLSHYILRRITNDIYECIRDVDVHNIFVVPDSENILIAHTIIIGPANTPYEGGFFYFFVKFPANYPLSPPKVKIMNTEANNVRFNPNVYTNGKISLSILGTYGESSWGPSNTLFDVLISIKSIMDANPCQTARFSWWGPPGAASKYIDYIRHETLRVAVINFMKEDNLDYAFLPNTLRERMIEVFKLKIPAYLRTIRENYYLNETEMDDPFNWCVSDARFNYKSLRKEMVELAKKHLTDRETIATVSNLYGITFDNIVDSDSD